MSPRPFDPGRFEVKTYSADKGDDHGSIYLSSPLHSEGWQQVPHLDEFAVRRLRIAAAGLLARVGWQLDAELREQRREHECAGLALRGEFDPCGVEGDTALAQANRFLDDPPWIGLTVPEGRVRFWRGRALELVEQVRHEDAQVFAAPVVSSSPSPAREPPAVSPSGRPHNPGEVLHLHRRRPAS